jgi:hypothetical protein
MGANVDTGRIIDEFEQVLHSGQDMPRCHEAMVILRRWQWDEDLSDSSRDRAGILVRQFGRQYAFGRELFRQAP